MLFLFSNTKPFSVLILVGILVVLGLPGLLNEYQTFDYGGPGMELVEAMIGGNKYLFWVIQLVLILAEALILNRMLIVHRIIQHRNYFVSLIYVLLSGSMLAFSKFSPVIMGMLFILLAINVLLTMTKDVDRLENSFNTGLLLGLAGLVSPGFHIFLLPSLLSIFFISGFRFREFIALVLGWVVPIFLVGVGYYWFDHLSLFWASVFDYKYALFFFYLEWTMSGILIPLGWVGLVTTGIMMQPAITFKQSRPVKQRIQLIYFFLFTAVGLLLFSNIFELAYFYFLVPFLAAVFGVYFSRQKSTNIYMEIYVSMFFVLVLLNVYVFQFG